jgi:hypothetical protein
MQVSNCYAVQPPRFRVDQIKRSYTTAVLTVGLKRVSIGLVTAMATSQFKEWMDDYETKLREGVQKRFGLMDGISDKTRLDDEKQEKDQGESPTS